MNPTDLNEYRILDHGFVRLVDHMGNDNSIVQAARVSYGPGTKTSREDASLINYLMRNHHTSPFEMVTFKLHVKMPIFLARQMMRHRTASMNETSLRYSEATDEFYLPAPEHIRSQGGVSKQSSEDGLLPEEKLIANAMIQQASDAAWYAYKSLLSIGVAREQARMVLPVNLYTEFYWQQNLHNLLHLLRLRLDAHAQSEFQEYAKAIASIVQQVCPVTWEAFSTHILNSKKESQQ